MSPRARRNNVLVIFVVAGSAFGLGPGRAEAQWGMGGMGGFGMGWGWGGFSQVEKPDTFLYSKALVDAQREHAYSLAGCLRQQSQLLHQSHSR